MADINANAGAGAEPRTAYDLLVVLDATASMSSFIHSLNKSLPEIISVSALTGCFERIGVVAYRDYRITPLTEWSGWCSPSGSVSGPDIVSQEHVLEMASNIKPAAAGHDWPEAAKTGFARAYQEMRPSAITIIMFYADAPPHLWPSSGQNYKSEQAALKEQGSYGGTGHIFLDWVSAATTLKSGPKKAVFFGVVSRGSLSDWSPYVYMADVTGGALITAERVVSSIISQLTLGMLLSWMGVGASATEDPAVMGDLKSYREGTDLDQAVTEKDANGNYFKEYSDGQSILQNIIESRSVTLQDMSASIKARGSEQQSISERYMSDGEYKKLAVQQLQRIISTNVTAISLNPIFGTLWRTVCNDRTNEARDGLITMFGLEVDRIPAGPDKDRMKSWLDESYDYAAEIQEIITNVPADECFPMVFLDPTADFESMSRDGNEDEDPDNRPINKFTRAELLEIGRSCDYKILRRLGKVLTRLTYIEKKEDLPAHIEKASADEVPRIPMALADPKHKRIFWKILLHAVLPGTKITSRPAAVLAALALRMGVLPLRDVADRELIEFRTYWNTLDVPETWNVGCLSLLLDAERDYEARVAEGLTSRSTPETRILNKEDSKLFKILVDYKMLEMNMKTTLQAKVGWHPEKTKVALGPLVICRQCKFPRSVTIMARDGICGICQVEGDDCSCEACTSTIDQSERVTRNVSHEHNEKSTAYWVECNRAACRAQYVVYNPDALNVRAKCYYCRHEDGRSKRVGQAPVVECSKCLSCIIWPVEYRPKDMDLSAYECAACTSNVATIITQETSAKDLSQENGREWLLTDKESTIREPFGGRSVFYTASNANLEKLATSVEILPDSMAKLTIAGKLVQNEAEVKASLKHWVISRRTEAGVCSLCFSNVRKTDLRRACGRAGCHQMICNGCTKDWYGLNASGRIINVAALSCPFCRRRPAPKTVAPFGLAQLGNLRAAVEEAGTWVYAWCSGCGFAKQHVERACAAGAPPEVSGWRCEGCNVVDSKDIVAKDCPRCGVATQKTYGCDHISCPCGAHWCYACGKDVGYDKIYAHMSDEHGGWWGGGDEEEDEDDEYDY
ncbi:hypothetical protein G7046_g596 [Stylonectria norvegica]|nr:hypothetical protein G7046_g596 [Stylonectria norvegica]